MMDAIRVCKFLLWLFSSTTCLIIVLAEYDPVDNYLIDCGSSENVTVANRVFVGDSFFPNILSTPFGIPLKTMNMNRNGSILFQTARIFNETTSFSFPIKAHGRHWIRLHFFPFANENYSLSSAKFSVSSQNFTLLKEFQPQSDPVVKEYSVNVTKDVLILTFNPSSHSSFAFLNALEILSLPDDLLPSEARAINLPTQYHPISANALETMARLNMGNSTVSTENDTLWRVWIPDEPYLMNKQFFEFKSNISAVNYSSGWPSTNIAPPSVYGTVTMLSGDEDPTIQANITWLLGVEPGFDYLVRLHFCDFVTSPPQRIFLKVYANSLVVVENLDLSRETSFVFGAPYYQDFVVKSDDSFIRISIAPSTIFASYAIAILSGLEIMKISNPDRSLVQSPLSNPGSGSGSGSKPRLLLILGIVGGVSLVLVGIIASMFIFIRKIRRRRGVHGRLDKDDDEEMVISGSKIWYRYTLSTIAEATDNFSESNVIGFGGFGRVYKGILKDGTGTVVAVKRGDSRSQQGVSEFRTEIEMLSLFRHRHLVSLIGYCDEQDEMIIIYEYMQNGTLRNHLYDSIDDVPSLTWRKRLEICIGSAKALHYLHTGTAKAIIHRDVKSSNILLDENLMAKVSDFGISRIGPDFNETHVSTAVKGSFGYLDPEYLTSRQLTEKSDVYSFGVVMLEVLCGRPVIDPSRMRGTVNLVDWVMEMEKRGELEKTVDGRLKGEDIRAESVRKFGEIAVKCLSESGNDRPTMGTVLWNLESALQLQSVGVGTGSDCEGNGKSKTLLSSSGVEEEEEEEEGGGSVFSTVSMGDLNGVSISRVFSQMVKAEVGRTDEM